MQSIRVLTRAGALALAAFAIAAAAPARGAGAAAADTALAVLSTVPADVPQAAFDARLGGDVHVRVHVLASGVPDSAVALDGAALLRPDAARAARWWLFAPPPHPVWTRVTVAVDGRADVDPLPFDIARDARDNEAAHEWQGALDAWAGALARVGRHPTFRNEWSIRERAVRLAQRMASRPRLSGEMEASATVARGQQGHLVAALDHAQLVEQIDRALAAAPWWAEAYQWRAASLAQCGRGLEAMRSTELFRVGARDSVERSIATRALARFAAGDTLGAGMLLEHEGRQFNTDADAGD